MWILIAIVAVFAVYKLFFVPSKTQPVRSPIPKPTSKKVRGKNKLPDNIVITEEFKKAFDLLENSSSCAYITGKAGTGKSTLLTYFMGKTQKNVIVLAPTGIAAINVGGTTIHSFFRFAPTIITQDRISRDINRQDLFNKIDMIVIDEISMVRADLLDGIDHSLRINRRNDKPFGGVQLIFFGDLYQLPPVVVGKDLNDYFEENFGGSYFFNAKVFAGIGFEYIELQKIFRQKDENFKNILNGIRQNKVSITDLALLNSRFSPNHTFDPLDISLTLATTNKIADDTNKQRLERLTSKGYNYAATIEGRFDESSYPTDPNLYFKVGAQVMLLKNDKDKRWVNGTLGIIKNLRETEISVEIEEITYTIEKATWEVIEYQYNKEEKKIEAIVTGSFTQYPLKLAWAITIHKSQGQTFDRVIVDLGGGAFAHGQTYVALSRCKSLEGLVLKTQIRPKDIILDSKVVNFIQGRTNNFLN